MVLDVEKLETIFNNKNFFFQKKFLYLQIKKKKKTQKILKIKVIIWFVLIFIRLLVNYIENIL